jgi:hypothetical protein
MTPIRMLETTLENHPGMGYLGALPPVGSAVINYWQKLDQVFTSLGLIIGLVIGVVTALIQIENYRKKRRDRKSREAETAEPAPVKTRTAKPKAK